MVSFSRIHYRISLRRFFARGAYRQEGPTGQRGLLASGGGFCPVASPLATPLLSNARSGDLHFGTSFVALRALVREIIPKYHTYPPTHIHT